MDKARFAYGSLQNLEAAIAANKIDEFDLLCLLDDGVARIGWLDRNKQPVLVDTEPKVIAVDTLPETGESGVIYIVGEIVYIWAGGKFVAISESTDLTALKEHVTVFEEKVSALEEQVSVLETEIESKADAEETAASIAQAKEDAVASANAYADEKCEAALDMSVLKKYEITSAPVGTLVDYREKEIRVMVPADTEWTLQNVGSGGSANKYYIEMRAYAPENANSYMELTLANDPTIYYFENNGFAGVDKYGRKYAITWWSVAEYDESTDTWTYYGAESTKDSYFVKDYYVEWYDVEGNLIASDAIKVTLSNEDCHSEIMPFYMGEIEAEIKQYTNELIEAKIEEIAEIPVVEF